MRNYKKFWHVLVAMLLISLVATACGGEAADDGSFKASIVTDTAGLGDQSFNDSAKRGLDQAADELGIETQVYETAQAADYEPNLAQAPAQGNDLTFAIGFLMTDALTNASAQNPEERYAIIDSVVESDNVMSLLFKEEEGSFLVGVVAGLVTESNTIGFYWWFGSTAHQEVRGWFPCRRDDG